MKLILTDYIASLKEDKELDSLILEILRESEFEIIYAPHPGRQYGVDIYAVGPDTEDNIKKVFLIAVKQGNLDRKNWHDGINALQPSLQELCTNFIRNNLSTAHLDLPIKIIIAHNGTNDPAIAQNLRSFAEQFPKYEFDVWQLETLVNFTLEKLINENILTDKSKLSFRKILIYCYNPDYDFKDLKELVDDILASISDPSSTAKLRLRQLKKINLIVAIVTSYCVRENDLRLALKATEIVVLRVWKYFNDHEESFREDFIGAFLSLTTLRRNISVLYLNKMLPICEVKDGFSIKSPDPVTYSFVAYEHMGLIALAGIEALELADMLHKHDYGELLRNDAQLCANGVINLFNNNAIVDYPRSDDQLIEWSLVFTLLFRLDLQKEIRKIMISLNNHMAHAQLFFNIAPVFNNSADKIFQLDSLTAKRVKYNYGSSSILTMLFEWTVVLDDEPLFNAFYTLKDKVFNKVQLVQWFPDDQTEKYLFTENAVPVSGYCLTIPTIEDSFDKYKEWLLRDYIFNCQEVKFKFVQESLLSVGLIASRHYRTYVFPYYWRSRIPASCEVPGPMISDKSGIDFHG